MGDLSRLSTKNLERPPVQDNNIKNHSPSYHQLSTLGLDYLHRQNHTLILSLIYPLFTLILQIFNTFFILNIFFHPPGHPPPDFIPHDMFRIPFLDELTPTLVFIVLAVVALIKISLIFNIRKNVILFAERQDQKNKLTEIGNADDIRNEKSNSDKISLTDIFYNFANHLQTIQKLSIFLYIICFFFVQWYIRYFLLLFGGFPGPIPTFNNIMYYFNLGDFIGLILFLIPDVRQFIRWNKKLSKLKSFEQRIYSEFER